MENNLKYVSRDEVKHQIRMPLTDTFDDDWIDFLITAASDAVKDHLKDFSVYQGERDSDDDYHVDSNHERVIDDDATQYVKPAVKQAVILLVKFWYDNPDDMGSGLPNTVTSILNPLRDPALR